MLNRHNLIMSKINIFWCFALLSVSMAAKAPYPLLRGKIVVQIEGIRESTGEIGVLLFDRATGFPGDSGASIRHQVLPARSGRLALNFDDLPFGTYAVAVIHDLNGNRRVDTNLLGIPREGYGFSNNARSLFRAPRFQEAAFIHKGPGAIVRVEMIY